jgi:hypothetical protein
MTVAVSESKYHAARTFAVSRNLRPANPNFGSEPVRLPGGQKKWGLRRKLKIESETVKSAHPIHAKDNRSIEKVVSQKM